MVETSTETLNSTDQISIPDKYFKFKLKSFVVLPVLIVLIALIITFSVIISLNYFANEKFMQNYRFAVLYNIVCRLNNVSEVSEIKNIIKESLKNRWVKSISIYDGAGNLVVRSIEKGTKELYEKRVESKYKFIFTHLWQFKPDGTPIPLERVLKMELAIISALPVYVKGIKKYIVIIKFDRFMFKPFLFKYKIFPWYLFFIEIGAVTVIVILLVLIIISLLLKQNYKAISRNLHYILLNLYKTDTANLPLQIKFNKEKFKNNIVAEYINFINNLLDKFYHKLQYEIKKGESLRRILPPLILKETHPKEIKVLFKSKHIDLPKRLWDLYFKNEIIGSIRNYSAGLYHFKREEPNVIFKFINITSNKKGFFIGEIKEKDAQKKAFLLSFINYFLNNRLENIDLSSEYLGKMNNLLNRIGYSELKFDALYAVLNTETGYIEISSTQITPLIFYKAEDREVTYYQFDGISIGARWGDEFLQKLKKESFKLSSDDTLVILNRAINNLVNFDGDKYDAHNIVKTIYKNFPGSAEVLIDKIKDSMKDFLVDFSKIDDLIILIIKKDQE